MAYVLAHVTLPGRKICIYRHFILDGFKNGFDIIDKNADQKPAHCENRRSAQPGSPLYTSNQVDAACDRHGQLWT